MLLRIGNGMMRILRIERTFKPGTCHHSIWKAGAGGLLLVQGHPNLHNELQISLGYTVRLCLKGKKRPKNKAKQKTQKTPKLKKKEKKDFSLLNTFSRNLKRFFLQSLGLSRARYC